MAIGVVFGAFDNVAIGFHQSRGAEQMIVRVIEIVSRACLRFHLHQHLIEGFPIDITPLNSTRRVGFGQGLPAVVIVAGGNAAGDGLDAAAQGVVGVFRLDDIAAAGDPGKAVFVIVIILIAGLVLGKVARGVVRDADPAYSGVFVDAVAGVADSRTPQHRRIAVAQEIVGELIVLPVEVVGAGQTIEGIIKIAVGRVAGAVIEGLGENITVEIIVRQRDIFYSYGTQLFNWLTFRDE